MIKNLVFCLICTFAIGRGVCHAQPFFHDLRDGENYSQIFSFEAMSDGYMLGRLTSSFYSLSKYNYNGQLVHNYLSNNYIATNVSWQAGRLVLYERNRFETQPDSIRISVLDSSLNILKQTQPSKRNWPRKYFGNRSTLATMIGSSIAYFGPFTDSLFTDSTSLDGWLILNSDADSLVGVDLNTNYQGIRLLSCFPSDDGYYGVDPITSISYPWSPSTSVTSIAAFDDSMRWLKTINFGMPSNLPGFPRLVRSADTRTLAINSHSVYAVAQYEAMPPLIMGETRKSCAVYRFDRELNRMQVVHDTAVSGKVAETTSRTKQITFDQSGAHLYIMWKECDPRLSFDDQTRACATIVLKYDTALNLIWRREFAFPEMYFYGETLTPTTDGGVLIAGLYIDVPPAPNVKNVFVLKLDSIGSHVVSVPGKNIAQAGVVAFPNPAIDMLQLKWQNAEFDRLIVHDLQGRLLWQQNLQPGTTQMELPIHDWTKGVYFYRLRGADGSWRHGKFIKQ